MLLARITNAVQHLPALSPHIMSSMSTNPSEWSEYLKKSSAPLPPSLQASLKQAGFCANYTKLIGIILVKEMKRQHFTAEATRFADGIFGHEFFPEDVNFAATLQNEINPKYPILLCSKPGYDASTKVDALAEAEGIRNYHPIAIGSKEGFDSAEKAIDLGMLDITFIKLTR